jgi:hypothetical protein
MAILNVGGRHDFTRAAPLLAIFGPCRLVRSGNR